MALREEIKLSSLFSEGLVQKAGRPTVRSSFQYCIAGKAAVGGGCFTVSVFMKINCNFQKQGTCESFSSLVF